MLTARPTIYRGIQMRFAARSPRRPLAGHSPQLPPVEYEPTCFAGIAGQYLPDFVLHHRNFDSYIEVKSHTVREGELEDTLRRMPVTGNPSRAHSSPSSSGTSDAILPRSSPACTAARSAVIRAGV
jgi:hypothetical protein